MKLTATVQVSVDGVAEGNGGSAQNRPGFDRGGWARPLFCAEALDYVGDLYQAADAFLFGRWTYELFAGYWGVMAPGSGPIADGLNGTPKYVVSSTPATAGWAGTTVLSGSSAELVERVRELTAAPGGEVQVHGSLSLVRWLLAHDLVDELNLLVVPVVVGQGERLFPESGPDLALELVESRAFPGGTTLLVYRPSGRPQYAAD